MNYNERLYSVMLVKKSKTGVEETFIGDNIEKSSLIILMQHPNGVPKVEISKGESLYLFYKIGSKQFKVTIGDKTSDCKDDWYCHGYSSPMVIQSIKDNKDYSCEYGRRNNIREK